MLSKRKNSPIVSSWMAWMFGCVGEWNILSERIVYADERIYDMSPREYATWWWHVDTCRSPQDLPRIEGTYANTEISCCLINTAFYLEKKKICCGTREYGVKWIRNSTLLSSANRPPFKIRWRKCCLAVTLQFYLWVGEARVTRPLFSGEIRCYTNGYWGARLFWIYLKEYAKSQLNPYLGVLSC